MQKICLIFPRFKYVSGDPPLGIGYLASCLLQQGFEVSVIDTTFNPSLEFVRQFLKGIKPDIVGVYLDTIMYRDGVTIIRMAREMGFKTVVGGPHATMMPSSVVSEADIVAIGEGEVTLGEIAKGQDLNSIPGTWFNEGETTWAIPRKEFIQELDQLPFPALTFFDMKKYIENWHYLDCVSTRLRGTNIITSRGCSYHCTFCQHGLRELFGSKVRRRSPQNVVGEIKTLQEMYNINAVFFQDDTFTLNKDWVYQLCALLEREVNILWACNTRADAIDNSLVSRMREVGLRCIHMGIESASQRILDNIYEKGITVGQVRDALTITERNRIKVLGFFMLGAPTETREEVEQTIKLARSLPLSEASFSITSPLPGTRLYEEMRETYNLSGDFDQYDYYSKRSFKGELDYKTLRFLQRKAFLLFYLHHRRWGYILRHLLSLRGWRRMLHNVRRYR